MSRVSTLGALAAQGVLEFGDGYRTRRDQLGTSGFRIIRVADVADGVVGLAGEDHVTSTYEAQIGRKAARAGDVLLTTKGTVGRVAIMPPTTEPCVYSPQLCYFRVRDTQVLDPRFLGYWLRSDEFSGQAAYMQGNTDMAPYISLTDLRTTRVDLPPLIQQRAIADVLGALDDKIAANTRLAATADALARARFRNAVDSVGRGAATFADVADVGGGGTPRSGVEEYWNGTVRWLTPTDVTALPGPYAWSTGRKITEAGLASCASALYPRGTIFMTSRATIGAFAIAYEPMAVNQGFIAVQPRSSDDLQWLFHEMRDRVDEFLDHANGATFMELSRGNFKKLPVRWPDDEARRSFADAVAPLHASAASALRENERLAATRDALLPALMSGRLSVREADSVVTAGAHS